MKNTLKIVLSASLIFAGCTKEKPYEVLFKERVIDKNVIQTEAEYLYLPSLGDSPRTQSATRPHWGGEEKIVRFKFNENSLDLLEVELEGRFQGNKTNLKPVLSIPIKHLAYRCQKNANDECSNKEEENTELPWEQKNKFQLDLASMQIQETNFLPIEITNLFEGCYQELGSNLIGFDLDQNALNIKIEKTFKTSIQCAGNLNNLSDLTFNVAYNYSIVRMDQLISPEYDIAMYPNTDKNTFGFFESTKEALTVDNREEEKQLITMISRWNPKRNSIPYYLSDAFYKPENRAIKEAALKGIQVVNESLKAAGVSLSLHVQNEIGKNSGDLRNNTIVLVEDPTPAGIIGYGPSAKNPRTGEIVHARTVMYLGNIKKFIRSTFDEIVEAKKEAQRKKEALKNGNSVSEVTLAINLIPTLQEKNSSFKPMVNPRSQSMMENHSHLHIDEAVKELKDSKKYVMKSTDFKEELETLSKNNAYPAALFNFDSAIASGLEEQFEDVPLKLWDELTESEKSQMMNKLVPYVFTPVLVHEIGHNLGLRHNFNGSEDKTKFYSPEELEKRGLHGPMNYSSIMDYAYRTTNELRVMGKYDIAALKFGYARKVDLQDGGTIPVRDSLDEMIKSNAIQADLLVDYMYCTDEHVGLNPGCKRFDEGTNLTEIAQHYIQSYQEQYTKRNFRKGRKNFSLMDDPLYAANIKSHFYNLRMFFESYERIQEKFNLPPELWETNLFLKDLKKAMLISAEFFIDVLKTPDTHCAIALKSNPSQIVGFEKLASLESLIGQESINCFSIQMADLLERVNEQNRKTGSPELLFVAETGKSFSSKKDPNSTNSYVDQVDQRGIWMDKLLASQFLFGRKTGMFTLDRFQTNYLHVEDVKSELKKTLDELMKDELVSLTPLRNPNGETIKLSDGRTLVAQLGHNIMETHFIQEPLNKSMYGFIKNPLLPQKLNPEDMETKTTWFLSEAFRIAAENAQSNIYSALNASFFEEYSLYKTIPQNGRALSDFTVFDLNGERYLALPENIKAIELIEKLNQAQKPEEGKSIDPEVIQNLKLKLDSLIVKK